MNAFQTVPTRGLQTGQMYSIPVSPHVRALHDVMENHLHGFLGILTESVSIPERQGDCQGLVVRMVTRFIGEKRGTSMPEPVNSVLVVVASPGDAAEERAAVREALNDWSIRHGRRQGVVVLPWLYERHAVPAMGGRPQALINSQAVDNADVVVAFFDSRLGSSTGVDVSGTAEEIRRAAAAGKPVHVYFSTEPIPRSADREQLASLEDFRRELQQAGLLGEYSDPSDLAGQVEYAIQHDVTERGWAAHLTATSRTGAQLRWRHESKRELKGYDKRGKAQYRQTANDLVVSNESDITVEDLIFQVTPLDEERPFHLDEPAGPVTLNPHSAMQWLLIPLQGSSTLKIDAEWNESGIRRTGQWTVAVG